MRKKKNLLVFFLYFKGNITCMHCETKLDFSIGWALGSIYQILKEKSVPMGFSNNRGRIQRLYLFYLLELKPTCTVLCCFLYSLSICIGLVFCFQNCFDLLWEKNVLVIEKKLLKLEAECQEFANFLRSLEHFFSNSERSVQFLKQNAFLSLFLEVSQI